MRPGIAIGGPARRAATRRLWEPTAPDGAILVSVPQDPGVAASAAPQSTAKRLRSRSLRSSGPGPASRLYDIQRRLDADHGPCAILHADNEPAAGGIGERDHGPQGRRGRGGVALEL